MKDKRKAELRAVAAFPLRPSVMAGIWEAEWARLLNEALDEVERLEIAFQRSQGDLFSSGEDRAHLRAVLRLIAFGLPDADGIEDAQHLAWVALGRPE